MASTEFYAEFTRADRKSILEVVGIMSSKMGGDILDVIVHLDLLADYTQAMRNLHKALNYGTRDDFDLAREAAVKVGIKLAELNPSLVRHANNCLADHPFKTTFDIFLSHGELIGDYR